MSSSGCPHTIDSIYRNNHNWLHNWLCHRLGCSEISADLAQDTFLRLLLRREKAQQEPVSNPRGYLKVIARGLVVDHYRRRSLEQAYQGALAALPEPATIPLEEQQSLLETINTVDALLAELPHKVRDAFLMSQLKGMTYEQIATKMAVSERTIKRYMQQAFSQCIKAML